MEGGDGKRQREYADSTDDARQKKRRESTRTLDVDRILDRLRSTKPRVDISEPKEVAWMSRDKSRSWLYGDRSGYGTFRFKSDMLPVDLNVGFDEFNKMYETPTPDSLQHVLRAIQTCSPELSTRPQVVSWRGILTKIMTTPFLSRDEYIFTLWKYKGVLYLSNRETEEKIRSDQNMNERMKRFMYYGYKFEEVCTRNETELSVDRPVDPSECFCRIFKSRIGSTAILGAAEMDCFDPNRNADVELKVSRQVETPSQRRSFEKFKLLKFFCQSFLSGVRYVQVGFRDDQGIVRSTQSFETLKIPRIIKGREAELWDSTLALQFLDFILKWLLEEIPDFNDSDLNEQDLFVFRYDGRGSVSIHKAPRSDDEKMDTGLYL